LRVKLKRIKTLQKDKNQNNEDKKKKKTIHYKLGYKLGLKNETKTYETFIRGSKKINHKNKHQILNIKTE
jgi:hypothetical protein